MFDPLIVANSIIDWHLSNQLYPSHLRIQKLLYYVHGNFLGYTQKPLIYQPLEAWTNGPVSPRLYYALNPRETLGPLSPIHWSILVPSLESDKEGVIMNLATYKGNKWADFGLSLVDRVCQELLNIHEEKLVDMTHEESPWRDSSEEFKSLFGRMPEKGDCQTISNAAIYKFFRDEMVASNYLPKPDVIVQVGSSVFPEGGEVEAQASEKKYGQQASMTIRQYPKGMEGDFDTVNRMNQESTEA